MLTDETMLPQIKRQIPQMGDLLQAEQAYLDVILSMAIWLEGRMALLREPVMNIQNLKAKIKQITGWDVEILEDAERLTLTIRYYYDAREPVLEQEAKILMHIPAHLKVVHEFLQSYAAPVVIYAGAGMDYHTRYTGHMMEINGASSGTINVNLSAGAFIHTKLICYPEV